MVQAGCLAQAQEKNGGKLPYGGDFELGFRTTGSFFNDAGAPGTGYGGQFRIRFLKRLNTEWYADFFTVNINKVGTRKDTHIGWSLMFYPFNTEKVKGKFTPYIITGHCFDGSHVFENRNRANEARNFSSAVQMGLGTSYNLADNADITLLCQYMNHIGGHLHSNIYQDESGFNRLNIEKSKKAEIEGHLLITLSLNVKIADLWGNKKNKTEQSL